MIINLIISFILQFNLVAQDSETQGKDFWLTFPPNAHVNINDFDKKDRERDSLFIFFASNVPTDVRFTYWNYEGKEFKKTIRINEVLQYETFGIPWYDFEIPAQDKDNHRFGNGIEYIQNANKMSIHIESDEEITVLGHNQAKWSSDGMLVYPTKATGKKYILACYSSIYEVGLTHRASHFSIVASEDNTKITIKPTAELSKSDMKDVNITLNKGEVYYARAKDFGGGEDLTGTEVEGDKNFAVFSGVERTSVPYTSTNSRDYLVTQMSPFETSGIEYLVTPFQNNSYGDIHSKFRVIAYFDDTEVYLNDKYFKTLSKGEFFEADIDKAYHIKTSKTSYVYSIRRSGFADDFGNKETGDPFLLVNPPIQQFYQTYKVINFQAYEEIGNGLHSRIYNEHFITIVLKQESIVNTLLDFKPLPSNLNFVKIHNTEYVYAHIPVNLGTHLVSSADPILCYSYGYGYANSYGSVGGGLKLRILDHNPPGIKGKSNCDNYEIDFSELNNYDSGLDSIMILDNENIKYNDNLNGDSLDNAKSIFSLVDPYQDGYVTYRIYDKFGLYSSDTIDIPGFTLSQEFILPDIPDKGQRAINDYYLKLKINNYGKFTQKLKLKLDNRLLLIDNPPATINPGEDVILNLKIEKESYADFDELTFVSELDHDCFQEKTQDSLIRIWKDNLNPQYELSNFEECEDFYDLLLITDNEDIDFGLQEIKYIQLDNIVESATIVNNQYEVKLQLDDIFQNGYYEIIAIDSANNEVNITGSIGGLVLELEENNEYTFEDIMIDTYRCDSITFYNKSERDFIFDNYTFEENINYSIPISQFPLLVKAKSQAKLVVCFDSENYKGIDESIKLNFNDCVENSYPLSSVLIEKNRELNSNCDLKIELKKVNSKAFNLSVPYPNPATNQINININNDINRVINFKLINNLGEEYFSISENFNPAYYNLQFTFNEIPNGNYLLLINSNNISETYKINIVK